MRRRIALLLVPAVFACSDTPTAPPAPTPSVEPSALIGGDLIGGLLGDVVYGIDRQNRLISFNSIVPLLVLSNTTVKGLRSEERIVGIDFRPADGQLYGVSSASRIYTINPATAQATAVAGTPFTPKLDSHALGFDFNPVADRGRTHSVNVQNLRLNQLTGTVAAVDTNLAYAAGDPNFGRNPDILGTAYSNSALNNGRPPTATELYAIDARLSVLVELPSPNSGQLVTVGALGTHAGDFVGFDIAGRNNKAYATLSAGTSKSHFFTVDLEAGTTRLVGQVGLGFQLIGIAVKP